MYLDKVKEHRKKEGKPESGEMEYLTPSTTKTAEGKALDDVGITKMCCRRMMLSHVDLV
jgi:DNA-directed RNA polymerase subunit N (RpoN/RPB10)